MAEMRHYAIMCVETGKVYQTAKDLALELETPISNVRKHLKRGTPLKGFTYRQIPCENQRCVKFIDTRDGKEYPSGKAVCEALGITTPTRLALEDKGILVRV